MKRRGRSDAYLRGDIGQPVSSAAPKRVAHFKRPLDNRLGFGCGRTKKNQHHDGHSPKTTGKDS
jgi:hypothetical protein